MTEARQESARAEAHQVISIEARVPRKRTERPLGARDGQPSGELENGRRQLLAPDSRLETPEEGRRPEHLNVAVHESPLPIDGGGRARGGVEALELQDDVLRTGDAAKERRSDNTRSRSSTTARNEGIADCDKCDTSCADVVHTQNAAWDLLPAGSCCNHFL